MRKIIFIFGIVFILGCFLSAGENDKSRDLYLSYNANSTNNNTGQPGTKVSIELLRNGKTYMVSPKTVFYSGDRIRFHFAVNFKGYIAVINKGSSGRRSLLFPQKGFNNRIYPTKDYKLPNKGWIKFDNKPGREQLTFIMSTRPIPGVQTTIQTVSHPNGVSLGGAASSTEEQEILDQLNSRVLKGSRDLVLDVQGDSGYCVTNEQTLANPSGFIINLIHK